MVRKVQQRIYLPIRDVLAQEQVMDDHKDAGIYALQGLKID